MSAIKRGAFTVVRKDLFDFSKLSSLIMRAFNECTLKRNRDKYSLDVFVQKKGVFAKEEFLEMVKVVSQGMTKRI